MHRIDAKSASVRRFWQYSLKAKEDLTHPGADGKLMLKWA
jgi:hypothetical protein